ncbi:hypothetical protein [Burkholderia vietnamiensis]|uniref:hypothetical protein n=1 Tax=Burkholderia vietnamiensis TaxID=60552 RepID=UPI0012D96822|nr:hypothetical protein [Burkholderia vietnamiensis]MDN7926250.1 hypothetical protein [Burkholderia vietnamiensis]HDR9254028.1 hypothetical protein [Burkholderia vietnamiensis]
MGELARSIELGDCSQRLEVFLDSIARTCGIAVERERPVEVDDGGPAPIRLGNKTTKQMRKRRHVLAIDTVLNYGEVLVKLSAISEARNRMVHSAGRVPGAST